MGEIQRIRYILEPGYIYITFNPTFIQTVLGSSVAVCIFDPQIHCAGINHYIYPSVDDPEKATPRYGNVSIPTLLKMMIEAGSCIQNMEAQIFGGAHLKDNPMENVGERNIAMAHSKLEKAGVHIVSEDTGGMMGRKIVFDTLSAHVAVLKVRRLRHTDWY